MLTFLLQLIEALAWTIVFIADIVLPFLPIILPNSFSDTNTSIIILFSFGIGIFACFSAVKIFSKGSDN